MLTDEQLSEAREWSQRHGPANCWTGASGYAAMLIRLLIEEVERLRDGEKNEP